MFKEISTSRFTLLLVIFITGIFPKALFAQNGLELVTGYSEYGVSGSQAGYPFNTYYHDHRYQSLYLASDLTAVGLAGGATISSVEFKISSIPGRNIDSLRIAIAWTTSSTLSSFQSTEVVYGPQNFLTTDFTVDQWVEFDFNTPIIWDGTSNLVVEYSHDNTSWVTGGGAYMSTISSGRGRRGYSDSGAGHYPFTSMNSSSTNYAARIALGATLGIQPASGLTATPSYKTVNLSWTASTTDSVSNYVIYRGSASNSLAAYDSVAATVVAFVDSNLTNGTTYYYGVKSKTQSGEYSAFMTTTSATPLVSAPTNTTATAGNGQMTFNWTAASGTGVAHTLIYSGTSSSNLSLTDSTSDASTTTLTITGLTNSTTYYGALRTRGNDGSLSDLTSIVSAVPQYVGPVWWVATNGNNSNDGSQSNPFATISTAYTAAAAGDTIKLKPGTFTGSSNRNITINKNLVITSSHGPDSTTIDAGSANRHFYFNIVGDTLTHVIGLTLKNSSSSNGSFYINHSSPRITNCVFKNNISTYNGGAVYIQSSSTNKAEPVFTNCTFRDNRAKANGGAIYMTGGSSDNQSTPRFISSTIISNDVISDYGDYSSGYGGGVYITGNMRPSFVDCQIDSNIVDPGYYQGYGGGVYISGYSAGIATTFTRCTFRGNSLTPNRGASGGGIYTSGEIELTNCLISGNSAVGGGSNYQAAGGGIFIHQYLNYSNGSYEASESKIINCTIVNNSVSGNHSNDYPGGIKMQGSNATVTMFNSIVSGNTSDNASYNSIDKSSSVDWANDYNNIEDYSNTLGSNSLQIDPLFTNTATGDFTLSDASPLIGAGTTSYDGNAAPTNDITGAARPNPALSSPDMGAYENSLSATPYPDPVSGLTGTVAHQSAVLSWTANSNDDVASYKVYKSTVTGFTPSADSLVATVTHPTVTYTVTGLTNGTTYYFRVSAVDDDSYEGSYSSEASVVPAYSGPAWWVATTGSDTNDGSQSSPFASLYKGITIASTGDTVKVKKGTYSGQYNRSLTLSSGKNMVIMSVDGADSTALDAGNAARHFYFSSGQEDTTFKVVGFTLKNGLSSSGGSIYINNSSPQFNNCTISDNKSPGYGGAIYISNSGSSPIFNNCIITSNAAESDAGDWSTNYGGGIYINSGSPTFNDCRISYNTASSGDYSSRGGGVYVGYFDNREYDPVTFNRCQFIGNTVTPDDGAHGGGLNIHARTVLSSCLVAGNTVTAGTYSSSQGGGLYISLSSYYNSETQLYETGEVAIINCTIVGNTAAVTSSGYSGQGGGFYSSGSSQNVTMFNSIVWDNTATSYGNIYSSSGSLTADYNDIEDGTDESYFGSNSLDKDPNFTNASSGDYTLAISSDLIGAGVATYGTYSAPTKDVAGSDRPNPSGSAIDMGAYESSYSTSPYPDAPSGLAATAGDGSVTLSWTAHSETDVEKYGLYYGTSTGPTVKQAEVSGRTTVTTTISNLSNNILYYFRITAIDGDSYESVYSSEVTGTPSFSGTTIYVDNSPSSAPANPDGSSTNAFYSIQDAIDAEATTDQRILVKAGTYTGSGSSSLPVIDLKGKNIIIESESGPDSTIIDAGGSRIALELDASNNTYSSGYNKSSTKFIGFTFKNGDDDKPLVDIDGPERSTFSGTWDFTFENCRFTSTTNDYGNSEPIIKVTQSNTTFDGCTFRNLDIEVTDRGANGPIQLSGGSNHFWINSVYTKDTTIYRPQFKNCVIASNSMSVNTSQSHSWNFYGGAVYVKHGAIPYFENTRIDSNSIDTGDNLYTYSSGNAYGGGVYLNHMWENGPPIQFVNCSISNNEVKGRTVYGGGIYSNYDQVQLINCVIVNNEANSAYTTSYYNYGYTRAAGVYQSSGTSTEHPGYSSKDKLMQIVNCTIADNILNPNPGSGNSSNNYGAGIYRVSDNSHFLMFNSIVYGNSYTGATNYSSLNMSTGSGTWGTTNSNIDHSVIQYFEDSNISGDDIVDSDPSFTGSNNYALTIASVAIGAGTSTFESVSAPAYDYNNSARPNPAGSNPDIGAFENSLSTTPYPSKPQNLAVTSVGDSTANLNWTAGSEDDLVRYKIYYGTSSPATTLIDSASGTATSKAVSGLTNGTAYVFRITSLDGDGYESIYSNEVTATPAYKGPVWYVDDDASSGGDGSPSLPMREIQDGIDVAAAGDTVMVLPGTYDRADDQELSFVNTDGTAKNIVLKSRDGAATTILDGESSRVFNIVSSSGTSKNDTSLQIIGFTITGSNGGEESNDGSLINIEGSYTGMWVNNEYVTTGYNSGATFQNCIIADTDTDRGSSTCSGVIRLSRGHARFNNCIIRDNSCTGSSAYGGAISVRDDSKLYVTNCKIVRNSAIGENGNPHGGAIYATADQHTVKIVNSIIAHNKAESQYQWGQANGGGLKLSGDGIYTIINSTIANNIVESPGGNGYKYGSGVYFDPHSSETMKLNIFNSIIYGNTGSYTVDEDYGSDQMYMSSNNIEYGVSHSILANVDADEFDFDDIFDFDPQFADTNYTLSASSLAIGAGTMSADDWDGNTLLAPTTDYSGNVRPNPAGSDPDLGAQESSLSVTPYPDSPTALTGTATHQTVSLSWTAPSADDVVRYYVYQADSSSLGWSSFTVADTLDSLTSTSTIIAGLTNETLYGFYVTALDTSSYESPASAQVKFKPVYEGPVWYVDENSGAGSHEGSPEDPMRVIQDAIDVAAAGDTVMVLPGTYDRPDDQQLEFITTNENGTTVGKNIVLTSRDGPATAILDGEGNKSLFELDDETDTTLQIIGFTIKDGGGNNNGSAVNISGCHNCNWNFNTQSWSHTYSGVTFKNCIFSETSANMPVISILTSNARFIDCEIKNNTMGGGYASVIVDQNSDVVFNRCKITDNTNSATDNWSYGGAMMLNNNSDVHIINSIIARNNCSSTQAGNPAVGGAFYIAGETNVVIINSTIVDNEVSHMSTDQGFGAVAALSNWNNESTTLTIINSILTGNASEDEGQFYTEGNEVEISVSYSLFNGVDPDDYDDGVFNGEPEFLDSTYVLHPRSAAIGVGTIEGEDLLGREINMPAVDIAGNIRPNPTNPDAYPENEDGDQIAVPDVGAWESPLSVTPYPVAPVDLAADPDHESINLSWTKSNESDVIGYYVYQSSDSITFTIIDTIDGVATDNYNVTGLTNGDEYWFYVTSVDTGSYESAPSLHLKSTPYFHGPKWYVDADNGSAFGEGSLNDPMREIQDAIDGIVNDGDTVVVLPGTYDRNDDQELNFTRENNSLKDVVLLASGGPDSTILDGEGTKRLFDISSSVFETDATVKIIGFTITNGGGDDLSDGTTIKVENGNVVFENCVIKDGDGKDAAVRILGADVIFRDCLIKNNRHDNGGSGGMEGAGIYVSSGELVLDRTKIIDNYTENTGSASEFHNGIGVNAYLSEVLIKNSVIAGNYVVDSQFASQTSGAGLKSNNSDLTLINSTIANNTGSTLSWGVGLDISLTTVISKEIVIFNSIIAGNSPSSAQVDISQNSGIHYVALKNTIFENSSNESWFDAEEGHYDFYPTFEDSSYSLSEYSAAIGRGGTSIEDAEENNILAPSIDLLGNPRPNPVGSNPDLGAYEHARSDFRRFVYYIDDSNGDDINDGLSADEAVKTIAEALSKSFSRGDTLELAPGTYSGSENRELDMDGVPRIIRTMHGPDSTIIDCQNQGPAFVFNSGENDSVHISGLTIMNGSNDDGGAISISGADPVFENMIFRDNNSDGNGGAVYASDSYSRFTNCVFANNHAAQGGAFFLIGGDVSLDHCTLLANGSDDNSGVKNASGDLSIMNSIYWGNDDISGVVDVSYSNVMGGYDGTMNFNGRPGFTDAENGDLTLLSWSPMIGRGSIDSTISSDIVGTIRADSVAPDLGAYENSLDSPAAYSPVTWHVSTTGTDTVVYSNIASIGMPFNTLQWTMDHILEGDSIVVHSGDYVGSADNGGKSVHIHGNGLSADEVSVLGELEFTGGSNSVSMLRVSNSSGDGFTISAGAIDIADILVENSSGKAIAFSDSADADIANVTLYGNGYGIYDSTSGTVTLVNSILWGNTATINGNPVVTYSDIQGGYTGTGNIDSDPLFTDALNGDFELDLISPCIDAGDPSTTYDQDSTVADMGAFPRLRLTLTGTSDGDVYVGADTTVVITADFTIDSTDTMQLEAGAELYFGPGVTLTVEGALSADGNSEGIISFLPMHPDSTFSGVVIEGGDDGGHRDENTYSYIQISGVDAASVPLTVNGSATLNHVTIAGNSNSVSLSTSGTVDLNYSILEGSTVGTVNNTGSFISSTNQFTDYANDDFTLLATAAGIDTDTSSMDLDPDYSYADAGAYYHDQTDYPVSSITIHRPATGDSVFVSPDTSSVTGSISKIQLFNAYDRYKTNGVVAWNNGNAYGSFTTDSTTTTDLDGMISNIYVTNTISGTHNSFSVTADDATSTSGSFLVEPGIPDSVWVTEQTVMTMTQFDSLDFSANIYDQFGNSVRLGESVTWSVNTVSGSGDGYTLSSDLVTTDASGAVSVTLYTDPTGNSLSVGDQATIEATSGPGTHISAVVTIIPSDIYNLALDDEYTDEQLNVSADTAYMDFYTALIDTFDNPLENVEVFWEVVSGQGTGESLSFNSSNTNTSGVATVRLNTNTAADSTYQVRCWVTEASLLNAFGSFEALAAAAVSSNRNTNAVSARITDLGGIRGIPSDRNRIIIDEETSRPRHGRFVPVQIGGRTTDARDMNRDAVYDLDDTTAVVRVWPGATASVSVPQTATDLLLDEQFGFTLDAYDQFNNLVRDNTPVSWAITPTSANVSIISSDDTTANGQATISLQVASNAAWDFSFTITATVEGISSETGTYRIDDVIAPAAVSSLEIDPSVWTSTNDFSLTWNNPSEHSGVAGVHYKIIGEAFENAYYEVGPDIQTLNISLPENGVYTVKIWLQDNAGNADENTAHNHYAKWDDTAPNNFDLTKPLSGWYNTTEYRFEWEASSDATAGLDHYIWSMNDGSETATISPDSTGHSPIFGLAQGSHTWTVTAYDSANNEIETSNPQTIQVDHTAPEITHNPVLEATENSAVVINAVFSEDGNGQSGIATAELYYRKGGESNWQPPIDMTTLSTYQIASSFSTSAGLEYYLHAVDVAGNVTDKPVEGFTSISVTITGGLASTDRWPTGIPSGTEVSSYQLWSFPGNPASNSPVDLLIDDLGDYDNTVWRLFAYGGGGAWTEFESLSKLNNGESYFIIVKDAGLNINTGQLYTITTNQPFEIDLTSGDWTFIGNPFDFQIPLSGLYTTDSTSLSGDPNFYTYDGSWTNPSSLEPWKGYIYKNPGASKLYINPGGDSGGMLGRQLADEITNENNDNEWLVNISARNGLGHDNFNEVGLLLDAMDTYDNHDAFEPPLVPGGISVRVDNRNWPEYADTYTRDIRAPKEEGEYWDLEIVAQDDEHNVYLTFEDLDMIPEDLNVFAIDVTLGVAQDLRWRHVYRYAVTNSQEKHNVRFIAGTHDFLQKNNAGVELFPDRFALSQNYPNPFNPQTSILLTMQDGATVNLVVYNLLGEEIAVLADNEYRPAGYHNFIWKGLNNNGQRVASGVYFYMAQVVSQKGEILISDTHKMVLVK